MSILDSIFVTVFAGLVLSVILYLCSQLWKWTFKFFRSKKNNEEILAKRAEIKKKLQEKIDNLNGINIIIRDISRMDSYPNVNEKDKGISSWFKLEYKCISHKSIDFFISIDSIKYDKFKKGWVTCEYSYDAVNAFVIGKIPFEYIVEIDWEGDEYYNYPHLYCNFDSKNKSPYYEVVYALREDLDGYVLYEEIDSLKAVLKRSKK